MRGLCNFFLLCLVLSCFVSFGLTYTPRGKCEAFPHLSAMQVCGDEGLKVGFSVGGLMRGACDSGMKFGMK